ncbi:MAG: NUDIX hydrolase, partial [Elusimicrobiales bacterium]|nr:NUDIX hydrolase [Elusimicrobiales bacterium]
MDHPGAVAVVAIDKDEKLVFVKQYRHPVGEVTFEIPAGKLVSKKDKHLKRAKAELLEETGYSAKKFKHLLDFWPTPAFSNEKLRIYIAW